MECMIVKYAFASLALAAACTVPAVAQAAEDRITVNVDHLQPRLAAEVEKHAAQGEKALARYMERTRLMHRLWFDDVTRARPEAPALDRKVAMREYRKHAIEYR